MARYSATFTSVTPVGTADGANLVDGSYQAVVQGGGAAQQLKINEFYAGGEAASTSSPTLLVAARDSVVGGTVTAGSTRNALLDATASASGVVPVVGNNATTLPQRSATLHLLHLSFNAYGGIVRWFARPGEELTTFGNTASLGEVSFSAYSGGTPGQLSGHVLLEAL